MKVSHLQTCPQHVHSQIRISPDHFYNLRDSFGIALLALCCPCCYLVQQEAVVAHPWGTCAGTHTGSYTGTMVLQ